MVALLEGRFADAEALMTKARGVGEQAQSWNAAVTYHLQLYVLRYEQGRLGEIADLVRRLADEYPTYPIFRCVLTHLAAVSGDQAEARDALGGLAADDFAALPFDEEWLVSVGLLAEAACALEDVERASVLYRLLLPYSERVAISYPEVGTGAVARYLGLLATAMRRWDEAEQHFETALATNRRIGARPWHAHTQHDYARMLLARRAVGDAEKAKDALSSAVMTYRALDMPGHVAAASALISDG